MISHSFVSLRPSPNRKTPLYNASVYVANLKKKKKERRRMRTKNFFCEVARTCVLCISVESTRASPRKQLVHELENRRVGGYKSYVFISSRIVSEYLISEDVGEASERSTCDALRKTISICLTAK
jgi:hypothetical protein